MKTVQISESQHRALKVLSAEKGMTIRKMLECMIHSIASIDCGSEDFVASFTNETRHYENMKRASE